MSDKICVEVTAIAGLWSLIITVILSLSDQCSVQRPDDQAQRNGDRIISPGDDCFITDIRVQNQNTRTPFRQYEYEHSVKKKSPILCVQPVQQPFYKYKRSAKKGEDYTRGF